MSSRTQDPHTQFIPLNKLKKSPRNVRQTPHGKAHIEALADSIEVHGQIQNLLVETELDAEGRKTGGYLVTAGEGRRLAQLLRVKRKRIKADEPVCCKVDDTHNAQALSLAENELRQKMCPADQFVAFKQLVDGGQSVEEVAAQFRVTPLVVLRRLKLANVAPEFIELYRNGDIILDHLMALAICEDHEKQREAWASLPKHDRHPESLRRALTENEIPVRDSLVKFVGLKAYEKAGGFVRRDLFAEKQDEAFVMDPELLRRLAAAKLEKAAAQLRKDGCAWVEVIPQLDYSTLSTYGRVHDIAREPDKKEQMKLDKLTAARDDIEKQAADAGEDDEHLAEWDERAAEIEAEIDALRETLQAPDPEQQALAGAIVSVGHGGELRVEGGLLKPEDAKRFARGEKLPVKGGSPSGPRIHSAALARRLSAHKTLALQATLAQRPDIALIALTQRLVLRTFFRAGYSAQNVVQIEPEFALLNRFAPDLPGCKAQAALVERGKALRAALPVADPAMLFSWLLQQPQEEVLQLCAYCVAMTVNGVSADENGHALDAIANAAGLDMKDWWSPTAETYFGSVSKARILEVVREAISPEVAAALSDLKKSALAKAAEERLAGKGWLPASLRVNAA